MFTVAGGSCRESFSQIVRQMPIVESTGVNNVVMLRLIPDCAVRAEGWTRMFTPRAQSGLALGMRGCNAELWGDLWRWLL